MIADGAVTQQTQIMLTGDQREQLITVIVQYLDEPPFDQRVERLVGRHIARLSKDAFALATEILEYTLAQPTPQTFIDVVDRADLGGELGEQARLARELERDPALWVPQPVPVRPLADGAQPQRVSFARRIVPRTRRAQILVAVLVLMVAAAVFVVTRDRPVTSGADVIDSVVFSPDGERIVIAKQLGTVQPFRLSDASKFDEPQPGPVTRVRTVELSADGSRAASATVDGEVRLWNTSTREEMTTLATGQVRRVLFTPDGSLVATVDDNSGRVRLWNFATGAQVGRAFTPVRMTDIAISPDGSVIATAGSEGEVQLWEPSTGTRIRELFARQTGPITALAFSSDGNTLATGGQDYSVRRWDVRSGANIGVPLYDLQDEVVVIAFGANGSRLAAAGASGQVRLWDLGRPDHGGFVFERGRPRPVRDLVFSRDGTVLAVNAVDDVELWVVDSRRPRGNLG